MHLAMLAWWSPHQAETAAECGCSLGVLDPRPGYHTASALWPLGLCAVVADEAAGTFSSEIVEGAAGSPAFRVTLDLPEGEPVVRSPAPLRPPSRCSVVGKQRQHPGLACWEAARSEALSIICINLLPCDTPSRHLQHGCV